MTAPARPSNGGDATIHHVASNALDRAVELETEATDLERRAAEKRRTAGTLRAMHAVATAGAAMMDPLVTVKDDPTYTRIAVVREAGE
jgi:hypothetical protein